MLFGALRSNPFVQVVVFVIIVHFSMLPSGISLNVIVPTAPEGVSLATKAQGSREESTGRRVRGAGQLGLGAVLLWKLRASHMTSEDPQQAKCSHPTRLCMHSFFSWMLFLVSTWTSSYSSSWGPLPSQGNLCFYLQMCTLGATVQPLPSPHSQFMFLSRLGRSMPHHL